MHSSFCHGSWVTGCFQTDCGQTPLSLNHFPIRWQQRDWMSWGEHALILCTDHVQLSLSIWLCQKRWMSLLLLSNACVYFSLPSRDSSLMPDILYSIVRSQLLPIQESATITQRDPITNRFLSPWTSVHPLDRKLTLGQMRQLSPGTGELFPYHEYYVLAIPTLGYY